MAISLTNAASRMLAAASNVATQMGSGTTEAEVQGLADLLGLLAKRRDLSIPALELTTTGKTNVTP